MRWLIALALTAACGSAQLPSAPSGVVVVDPAPVPPAPVPYAGPAIVTKGVPEMGVPKPTIIVLAVDAVTTLQTNQRYSDVADLLIPQGWIAVSLDLPAHGADRRTGEPSNALAAWASRLAAGEDIVEAFVTHLRAVMDGLHAAQMSSRFVIMGTSRGGFMALHAAANDSRIAAVLAFIPVTDLRALTEFSALQDDPLVTSLRTETLIPRLVRVPVWIETPATDTRVDAVRTLAFAEALRAASGDVTLRVEPGSVHTLPGAEVLAQAAEWVK
jgi:dienelactone hydrolase